MIPLTPPVDRSISARVRGGVGPGQGGYYARCYAFANVAKVGAGVSVAVNPYSRPLIAD